MWRWMLCAPPTRWKVAPPTWAGFVFGTSATPLDRMGQAVHRVLQCSEPLFYLLESAFEFLVIVVHWLRAPIWRNPVGGYLCEARRL